MVWINVDALWFNSRAAGVAKSCSVGASKATSEQRFAAGRMMRWQVPSHDHDEQMDPGDEPIDITAATAN